MTFSGFNLASNSRGRQLYLSRSPRFTLSIALTAVIGSAALGAFAASEPSTKTIELLLALIVVALLWWRFGLGVWLAVLVLGSVDALPGPQLETIETPVLHLFLSDTLIVILILTLLIDNARNGFRYIADNPIKRVLCIWGGVLLLLWGITVARSYIWSEIPLNHAMDFGRDFAFFAMLLPLFAATFTQRRVLQVSLVALAIGAGIAELAEIISIVTHHTLTFLVHASETNELSGLTRLYVNAQYLAVLAGMFGIGLLLLAKERGLRLLGGILALLSITSVVLELTRAQYIGMTAGLAAALFVWLVFSRTSAQLARVRFFRAIILAGALVALTVLVHPPQINNTVVSGLEHRVSSVFTSLSSTNAGESTVAYREIEAAQLEQVLGSHWLFGLGFLDPRNHYVLGLRLGSIRNGDVGVLNAVMTMGVVGAILIYFPVFLILAALVKRAVIGHDVPQQSWVGFGISAWCVSVLVSSLTLVSLFSSSGLCIAALALGIGTTSMATARGQVDRLGLKTGKKPSLSITTSP
jgi:hypothetical protein